MVVWCHMSWRGFFFIFIFFALFSLSVPVSLGISRDFFSISFPFVRSFIFSFFLSCRPPSPTPTLSDRRDSFPWADESLMATPG
ncbi:hypothetical protein BO71DRAFT_12513 [Aspergillus ellipticus CBS 707.79]|uniref:Uncharacterized protein n=1 Tax=Aspergillus ellipticus CBS 707.79 TaxID=1448320 RepID=A0A319D635_9EURO|nr:hypothetical protein BO71DRAFT_12513 [Aspergillus ellipticus CBS 707.79]